MVQYVTRSLTGRCYNSRKAHQIAHSFVYKQDQEKRKIMPAASYVNVLKGLRASRTARPARLNCVSGRQAHRPGRFNRSLGEGIRQRPVWLSVLPVNRPVDTRTGRPICWQDIQPNRPLFDLLAG